MFDQAEYTVDEFAGELNKLVKFMEDDSFEDPLRDSYAVIQADIQDHFDAGEGPTSLWPAHAPSTVERYGPHPLLIMSEALVAAAVGQGTGHISEIANRELRYGVSKEVIVYAGHDHGFPDRNIPQREYMWISDTAREEINDIIQKYVADVIGT